MKTTLTITFCLLLAASQGLAAQAGKKGGKPAIAAPREKADAAEADEEITGDETPGDETPADDELKDDAKKGGEDEPESAADEDSPRGSKSSKKPGGKLPIKLDEAGEAELIEKASYMQGYAVGKHFHEQGVDFIEAMFLKGFRAAITGKEPQMSLEEMATTRMALEKLMLERRGGKNKQEGEKFLAKNKKREGVKTLKSGLQYEVLKSGKGGKSPKPTDTVTVNFEGKLLDDQIFESSYARRQPAIVPVSQCPPGWKEALQLMKVGDKWRLFLPPDLAYGDHGVVDPATGRELVPPGSTVVFDFELLGINERGQRPLGQ